MNILKLTAFAGVSIIVSACSHRPLPIDVTREATPYIVKSIRCETRNAIRQEVVELFRRVGDEKSHSFTKALADEIEAGRASFEDVDKAISKGQVHQLAADIYDVYDGYAVGFDFELTMREDNDESANANFRLPFTNGEFTLNLSAGHNRQRQNKRIVEKSDTFRELFTTLTREECEADEKLQRNWEFPIAGRIGMAEQLRTFLALDDALKPSGARSKLDRFLDELTFTTTYMGSVTPRVVLSPPITEKFHLAEASGTLSANRTDVHKVTIAFAAPPTPPPDPDPVEVIVLNLPSSVGVARTKTTRRRQERRVRVGRRQRAAAGAESAKRQVQRDLRRRRIEVIDRIRN